MQDKIFRLNHDSFRIEGERVVYTDPFHLTSATPKADIVLVSHDHFDHCSPDDIKAISDDATVLVAIQACKKQLEGLGCELRIVKPGDKLEVLGVPIEVVPAYNTNKDFHPRKAGHVGYIIRLGGKRIYFAGDTDRIPEMKQMKVDIALLPVSGTYVMTAEEAVGAAEDLGCELVIPMHYADIVGTDEDAERFARLHSGQTIIKSQTP
jgi:L-ascorbate metabolism protein UlaG (beta-lactamase superfamily)